MIYFSDFGGTSGLSRTIASIGIASGTSTGSNVDYTSAAIAGLTPAASLVVGSFHEIANDPGETPIAVMSIGMIEAATIRNIQNRSIDNVAATSNTRSSSSTHSLAVMASTGGTYTVRGAGSNIAGGVRYNYTEAATNRRAMAACFTGVTAKAGTIALGTGASAIDVTAPGFAPDVVIFLGNNDDLAAGSTVIYQYMFGVATADGTQRCVAGVELSAVAAGGSPFQSLHTDCGAAQNSGSGTLTKIVASDFDANGFSVTPSASQGSDDLLYLALNTGSRGVKIVDLTTPTSTGSQAITGAGFTPQFAIVVLTNLEAVDSVAGTTSDLQSGFAISFVGDDSWATSWRLDSGADPTDTASQCGNLAIMGASATDCDAIKATLTSFDSDGMTVNYSAVQGTGKKGFILFFE